MMNNNRGIAGIAPQFRLMPIKDSDDNLVNTAEMVEAAWRWAVENGADVIASGSVTYDFNLNWTDMVQQAYASGKVIVNAAGNGGEIVNFPANLTEVLGVGATDQLDVRPWWSNAGPGLDLVAPGISIFAIDVTGPNGFPAEYGNCISDPDYWCYFGGTSAAAPQVAAVAGLVLSRMLPAIRDTASAELIYGILRHSSEDEIAPEDEPGYDYLYGWGRLNAARALAAVCRGDANNDGLVNISDAVYMVNYIFGGGPLPVPVPETGDADGSCATSISDAVYLINYVNAGGPPPPICTCYWTM